MPPLIEVRSANERGSSSNWSPNLRAGCGAVDLGPVDDELLRADARPFDETDRDLLVRPRLDGIEHLRIGDRRRIAFALQQELGMVDAARHVRGEHQQQIDLLGGSRRGCREQDKRRERERHTHEADHGHHLIKPSRTACAAAMHGFQV